jgi:hypothetical protein
MANKHKKIVNGEDDDNNKLFHFIIDENCITRDRFKRIVFDRKVDIFDLVYRFELIMPLLCKKFKGGDFFVRVPFKYLDDIVTAHIIIIIEALNNMRSTNNFQKIMPQYMVDYIETKRSEVVPNFKKFAPPQYENIYCRRYTDKKVWVQVIVNDNQTIRILSFVFQTKNYINWWITDLLIN